MIIGAALGSDNVKTEYVRNKVEKWMKDVEELASIAKEEPQAALSAYNTDLVRDGLLFNLQCKELVSCFFLLKT